MFFRVQVKAKEMRPCGVFWNVGCFAPSTVGVDTKHMVSRPAPSLIATLYHT